MPVKRVRQLPSSPAGAELPRNLWRLPRPDDQFGQKAARRGKWKYIHDRDTDLLFDLVADRGERHNLAYEHPDIVRDLKQALSDWEKGLPPPAEVRPK